MAKSVQRRATRTRALVQLEELVLRALSDMKAVNVRVMDVRGLTDVADTMIIASGNSDRHVRSIADLVIERAKQAGRRPMGTEGKNDAEWVLVDLQDVLVHVMLPRVREFYALEQLWEAPVVARAQEKPVRTRAAKSGAPVKSKAKSKGKSKAKSSGKARAAGSGKAKSPARGGRHAAASGARRSARPASSRSRG